MARMCSRIVIAVIIILTVTVGIIKAVDISSARYIATIAVQNTGSAGSELTVNVPISGNALSTGGYIASNTLNAAIVEGSTQVPSQPPSLLQSMDGAVHDDGGILTSYITEINNDTPNDVPLLPTTPVVDDAFYFGADNQFRILTVDITQAGSGVWDFAWEYWTGLTWTVVTTLDDRTLEFTTSGVRTVSFDLPTNWARQTVHVFADKYWLRARVSAFTSVTVQPLAKQAWWETGTWWLFEDSLGSSQQVTYTLALAATSTLVTNHQFFPGDAGYVTPDNAALELGGSGFRIELDTFVQTDILTGSVINKQGAIRLYNSAINTLKLEMNGVLSTTIANVPSGYYNILILDDAVTTSLAITGLASAGFTHTTTVNNSNNWEWGTLRAVSYFDRIQLSFPIQRIDDTTAEWALGTYSVSLQGPTSLEAASNSLRMRYFPPETFESDCVSNIEGGISATQPASGDGCFSQTAFAHDGSRSLAVRDNGLTAQPQNVVFQYVSGIIPGQVYSFSVMCRRRSDSGATGHSFRLSWVNSAGGSTGTDNQTATNTCTSTSSFTQQSYLNRTAPANSARVVASIRWTGNGFVGERYFDCYTIVQAATAPSCTAVGNLASTDTTCCSNATGSITYPSNWSFEKIFDPSGTRVSPSLNASSVSSLLESSVTWTAITPGTSTVQVEVSLNNGGSYALATNGGQVPGTTIGMNMAGMTDVLTRITLNSGANLTAAVVTSLTLSFLDSDDQDLLYAPQELIGKTLDDRSLNDLDATVSYPQGLSSQYIVSVSPITSTGVIDSQSQEVLGPTVTDAVPNADLVGSFNPATVPFGDFIQALSDITNGNIPALAIWYTVAGYLIVMVGLITYLSTGSIASSGAVMVFTTLGFTQIDGGLFPQWVFYMFAMAVFAVSLLRKAVFL